MNGLLQRLIADRPVLTDGAWATELQRYGLAMGDCPDAWNLMHPERVEAIGRAYVAVGSRLLLTNTFGANRVALARHGLADHAAAINDAGASIARRAADGSVRVFGAIGPTGATPGAEELPEREMCAAFAEQAEALAAGGVDAIVIETMSDLDEASLAVRAGRATGLPVVACMSFVGGQAGDRTLCGVSPEQAAEALAGAGADTIGANCGDGAATLLPICRRLRAATDLPLWLKPNAGVPELVGGAAPTAIYHTSPEEWVTAALALVEAGADFIGGCCGAGPAFIRSLAHALDRRTCL